MALRQNLKISIILGDPVLTLKDFTTMRWIRYILLHKSYATQHTIYKRLKNLMLHICAVLFGQTEGILEKYSIFAQSEVHYWLAL